jgi:large subunit ribosomal protein L24
MKIKVGDTVVVIAGKHRQAEANTGKVIRVLPKENKLVIEGLNMVTRHVRKTKQKPGKKVQFEAPMDASNVMLIDLKTKKRTRVGYKKDEITGKKQRISKKSNTVI